MTEGDIPYLIARCMKCPPSSPLMDPAAFLEHFAKDHMDIPIFECDCKQKFATLLYATLHPCKNRRIEKAYNINAPGLDARLLAVHFALIESIKLGFQEAIAEHKRSTAEQLERELRPKIRTEVVKEIQKEQRKKVSETSTLEEKPIPEEKESSNFLHQLLQYSTSSQEIPSTYGQREVEEDKPQSLAERVRTKTASTDEVTAHARKYSNMIGSILNRTAPILIPKCEIDQTSEKSYKESVPVQPYQNTGKELLVVTTQPARNDARAGSIAKGPHAVPTQSAPGSIVPSQSTPKNLPIMRPQTARNTPKDPPVLIILDDNSDEDVLLVSNDERNVNITVTTGKNAQRSLEGRVSYPKED